MHLSHRLAARLTPDELAIVMPRGRLKPFTPARAATPNSTYFWGGLARFDLSVAPPSMRLTFCAYGATVHCSESTAEADEFYASAVGSELTPPLSAESAREMGGLEVRRRVDLQLEPMAHAVDITVSGLGHVAVSALDTLRVRGTGAAPPMLLLRCQWR